MLENEDVDVARAGVWVPLCVGPVFDSWICWNLFESLDLEG